MNYLQELKTRNAVLYWFGWANVGTAVVLLSLSWWYPFDFLGANAWHKPAKFALSTIIVAWSVGWYTGYLPQKAWIQRFNWVVVATLGFEVGYIALQAARGMGSHFNNTTPLYAGLFALMALAASAATLAIGYVGWRFTPQATPQLSDAYRLSIRLGILLFVLFAFQGFAMGSNLAHTIGAADGSLGLPFLGWSYDYGDLRMAHFIGMHDLQVLPLLAHVVLKRPWQVWLVGGLYFLLALGTWVMALQGRGLMA